MVAVHTSFSFQIIDIRDILRAPTIEDMKDVYPLWQNYAFFQLAVHCFRMKQ